MPRFSAVLLLALMMPATLSYAQGVLTTEQYVEMILESEGYRDAPHHEFSVSIRQVRR